MAERRMGFSSSHTEARPRLPYPDVSYMRSRSRVRLALRMPHEMSSNVARRAAILVAVLTVAWSMMACSAGTTRPQRSTPSVPVAARALCNSDKLEGVDRIPIDMPFGSMSALFSHLTICPRYDIDKFDLKIYFDSVLEVSVGSDVELLLVITDISKSPGVEFGHGFDTRHVKTGSWKFRREIPPGQYELTLMTTGSESATYSLAVVVGRPSVGN